MPANSQVGVAPDVALGGFDLERHQFEQCRLARSVRSHQGDARVAVNPKLEIGVEVVLFLTRVGEGHILKCKNGGWDLLARREAKAEDWVGLWALGESRLDHLVDNLLLGLSLLDQVGVCKRQ